jgi:hypothetical protein
LQNGIEIEHACEKSCFEETGTYLTVDLINFTFALFALFAAKLSASLWLIINVNDSPTPC